MPSAGVRRARARGRSRAHRLGDAGARLARHPGQQRRRAVRRAGRGDQPQGLPRRHATEPRCRVGADAPRSRGKHAPERLRQGHQRRALAAARDPGDVPLLGRTRGGGVDDADAGHGVGRPRGAPDLRGARDDRHRRLARLRRHRRGHLRHDPARARRHARGGRSDDRVPGFPRRRLRDRDDGRDRRRRGQRRPAPPGRGP